MGRRAARQFDRDLERRILIFIVPHLDHEFSGHERGKRSLFQDR
ncbi:MAG TPA: hypothetical protein VHV51_19930 [Polyangiaceae bacterium]|nr:hypothetical protein [Polyangiaceae bacterium]